MKNYSITKLSIFLIVFAALLLPATLLAQDAKDKKVINNCRTAKAAFIRSDALMQTLFNNAHAYVIFPNVGKGAIGIGGAAGNGMVYEGGKLVGKAKMKQLSVGFQFGGQAYREVIFFENKAELDRFKNGQLEFAAQASAVAVKKGASANVNYKNGVMIFTQEKKGLMYEASIGGQKFSYDAF